MGLYAGENHSLAKKPNQIDYHNRIVDWFDHYLAGAPAKEAETLEERPHHASSRYELMRHPGRQNSQ
jgi:hypothetical protein